jgi:hypothetical protein
MSYDNMNSVSQNVLKFYQQLTGEERRVPFILVGTISNVLVMEIGWTDVGSGGYILVSCAHSNTSCFCSVSYSYSSLSLSLSLSPFSFLSLAHELVHGRSQELLYRIS